MEFGWMKGTTLRDVIRQLGAMPTAPLRTFPQNGFKKIRPPGGKPRGSGRSSALAVFRAYSRRPLMSLTRDRIMLQLQLTTPGKGSMTVCRKTSISSAEAATAWTWSLSLPVTR